MVTIVVGGYRGIGRGVGFDFGLVLGILYSRGCRGGLGRGGFGWGDRRGR